jgi:tetratricopeptide (TPR) repeat protein
MTADATTQTPAVFISYAHEGDMSQRVAELAQWLREHGVQVITDHLHADSPPEAGWRPWMQHSIEDAALVLIVCTERYKKIFDKRPIDGDGGYGVTWEGAIITSDLYRSLLVNNKFFPILPDDGEHAHVPAVLTDFHNNLRFPSGNTGILALIRNKLGLPESGQPNKQLLSAELTGPSDSRLMPREGEVIGRVDELAEVEGFLKGSQSSAAVCGHVIGSGGIGKTEVCKAALKSWLAQDECLRVFWVQVSDNADARRLLELLGLAVDLDPELIAKIEDFSQMRPHLPGGLYYLDNLESVAESAGGIELLRELSQTPGIRLLASSRVALDGVLGASIPVGPLHTEDAVRLFYKCWTGATKPEREEVAGFVNDELGGHALCITLLARLGRAHSWQNIKTLWRKQGTALARRRKSRGRLDSLEISFALTENLLAVEPGALDLWQFAALFPSGFDEELLNIWTKLSGHQDARLALAEHHLISINDEHISMLPPIARYALSVREGAELEAHHFDWNSARNLAYQCFIELSRPAAVIASSGIQIQSRSKSSRYLNAMERLCRTDMASREPNSELLKRLHSQLPNVYAFNALHGRSLLIRVNQILGDAMSQRLLGYLARLLGKVDEAREHFDKAIGLYQNEQNQLGLANALKSLGDLEYDLDKVDEARHHYDRAVELYQNELNQLGLANALKSLGDLESHLGNLDKARRHFDKAIELYQYEQNQLGLANTIYFLGKLESQQDNMDKARKHYDKAIKLYQNEQDQLGLANALSALGDLLSSQEQHEDALPKYQEALVLYHSVQGPMGAAYTLTGLIRCRWRLGQLEPKELQELAASALSQAANSGVESVELDVMAALKEVCEGDEDKLKSLLDSIDGLQEQ